MLPAPTAFSLFDEPFSGIMPVHLEALAAEMRRAKDHKGILLTNHHYTAVLPLCDVVYLYLLHHGRLLRLGPNREAELRDYGYLPAQASQGA